ncbi:MAG: peptide deformylase [Candidatus Peregrinibacteria bacterium]
MAKRKIVTGEDNPILRGKAKAVQKFDGALKRLVKDMKETLVAAGGLGLAAPQVGESLRVFIIVMNYGKAEERIVAMVNPIVTMAGKELEVAEEGCLSLPGLFGKVARNRRVCVEFFDVDGNRQSLELESLNAREVQHENDHLDGVLFIDKVGKKEEMNYLM